ncbi:MAG: sugar kinase [Ignavibacteria bacterium]|nr:sugar kinase [Ignavibacteria bacterium]
MSLLVVGSVALDTVETPFDKAEDALGGSATFISVAASYFTEPVHLVGVVGEDFADEHIEMLKNHKIDLEGLEIIKGRPTFRWSGKYRDDFNTRDTISTNLNVFENFDPNIPEKALSDKFVILGNIQPSLQMKVLEQMKNPEFVVLDTMNLWIKHTKDDLLKVLPKIKVLIINDSEAKELSEVTNLIKAAKIIMAMGPEYLIIKKGEHGALLFGEGKIFSAPAFPIETLFDPTGAGDTFLGGFTAYLHKKGKVDFNEMKKAVIYGSVMASFCCEKFSTKGIEYLKPETIEKRYAEFKELSQFD